MAQYDIFEQGCCIHLPPAGLQVYGSPGGQSIGTLKTYEGDTQPEQSFSFYLHTAEGVAKLDWQSLDFFMVGYEVTALTYSKKQEDYVMHKEGFWFSISEIKAQQFELTDWRTYLLNKSDDVLGYYAEEPGLRLREGPGTQYKSLMTLKGDLFEIKLMPQKDGLWQKVKVSEYTEHPCEGGDPKETIINRYEGWIKLLSDEHKPNVWYYGKGC